MKTKFSRRTHWGTWTALVVLLVAAGAVVPAQAEVAKTIQVNIGEAVTEPVDNVSKLAIAEPSTADVVPLSDKEISIIGKKVGVTTLSIVRTEGRPTVMYRIEVGNDAAAGTIRQMIGSSAITVRAIGDTLVLDGQVNDELEAARAVQIATAYKAQVLNLLEIKKPRQIKIRTRVAEVNSDAVKNIGFRWFGTAGEVQYALDFTGRGSIIHGLVQPLSSGKSPSDPTALDIGADVILQLLITKNYARLLSEPTLVTLSGKEASFLVGKEIPIVQQLPQSFTVEFKEVGVRMKIKPTADSQGQINTVIHAEVSQVTGAAVLGIPIIGSKKAETTLQVKDGQTVVIGGLLENNLSRDFLRKVPWLADIPIFGFLFRHKEFSQAQSEVLFFMTPEIVKDVDTVTAKAARTPVMKKWNRSEATKDLLKQPDPREDWGLHNPDGLGLPEGRQTRVKEPQKPRAGEPATNFEPSRPATR